MGGGHAGLTSEELRPQQGLGGAVGDGFHVHGRLLDVDVLCGEQDAVPTLHGAGGGGGSPPSGWGRAGGTHCSSPWGRWC